MPVDGAEHLVLGEQQRLQGAQRLRLQAHLPVARLRVPEERQALQETVHVHGAVGDAAEPRVATQVLHLVQVEASADQAPQGGVVAASDQSMNGFARVFAQGFEGGLQVVGVEELEADFLVVAGDAVGFQLLQRVGEGVVADVVEEGGVGDQAFAPPSFRGTRLPLLQDAERPRRQVVDAQGVVEASVRGTGVDEVGQSQLADVAEPLKRRRVHDGDGCRVQPYRVPEGIADDEGTSMSRHGVRQYRSGALGASRCPPWLAPTATAPHILQRGSARPLRLPSGIDCLPAAESCSSRGGAWL